MHYWHSIIHYQINCNIRIVVINIQSEYIFLRPSRKWKVEELKNIFSARLVGTRPRFMRFTRFTRYMWYTRFMRFKRFMRSRVRAGIQAPVARRRANSSDTRVDRRTENLLADGRWKVKSRLKEFRDCVESTLTGNGQRELRVTVLLVGFLSALIKYHLMATPVIPPSLICHLNICDWV